MANTNNPTYKLYYDAHAKHVIVDCKDGKDLESLIKNGEIGGDNKKIEDLQSQLNTVNTDISNLKKEHSSDISNLQKQLTSLSESQTSSTTQINSSITNLQSSLNSANTTIHNLQTSINDLSENKADKKTVTDLSNSLNNSITNLQTTVNNLSENKADKKTVTDLESKVDTSISNLNSKIDSSKLPIDSILLNKSSNVNDINAIGGKWKSLGSMELKINGTLTTMYMYTRIE